VTPSRLAWAAEDRVINLLDLAQGEVVGSLTGHTDRIPALAWHPDGRHLVSAGWDNAAWVWDTNSCQPVIVLNAHTAQVTALAFTETGELLASADASGTVFIWQFAGHKALHRLREDSQEIRWLAFDPHGRRLAAGGESRVIQLWDAHTGQVLFGSDISGSFPAVIAIRPDGQRLVSNGQCAVRLWNTGEGQHPEVENMADVRIAHPGIAHTVVYSPDGRWFATGGEDCLIRLWHEETSEAVKILEGQEGPVTSLAVSPDGSKLASASSVGSGVWVWDAASGEPLLLIPDILDGCTVQALAFHPGGRLLAAGGIDWLATGGSDGAACLWDLVDRCEVATFPGGTTCLAVHPSGRRLATASLAHSICLWDLHAQELVTELTGPQDTINAVAYSADGRWLACGGDDHTLRLWPMDGDHVIEAPMMEEQLDTQIKSLCFSPDSRFLFTGNGNTTCYRVDLTKGV
jgi:WD40 repeat protein